MSTREINRRELLCRCGQALAVAPFAPLLRAARFQGAKPLHATPPYQGTDDQLLDEIQRGSFQFFWDETNPATGQ